MKNLIKIAAASAFALICLFYINFDRSNNSTFTTGDLAGNHKQESNSKVKSKRIQTNSEEFRNNEIIEAREGFISPCFHHSKN